MYNRYIPNGNSYTRVVEQEAPPASPPSQGPQHKQPSPPPPSSYPSNRKNTSPVGIPDLFRLDDLDSGDILLILILLFLFRDGDDMELLITLGLILLIGLGDKKKNADRQDTVGV